ncbi:hypothetical protein [Anaerosolibacter sp.]|uniref:hypothetical protein n=1 Tax=Anaerosolibacter sp. TaxID=1872527 RepID=UPI0039F02222
MKKLRKILSFCVICAMIFASVASLSSAHASTNSSNGNITMEEWMQLVEKYDLQVISEEEALSLGLEKEKSEKFGTTMTKEETEQYILQMKAASEKPVIVNEDVIVNLEAAEKNAVKVVKQVHQDGKTSGTTTGTIPIDVSLAGTVGTNTVSTYLYNTSTPMTDLTLRKSVYATYKYDWTDYPGEPMQKFNYRFTATNNGDVVETTQGGATRMTDLLSTSARLASTTMITHTYSIAYDAYVWFPLPIDGVWVYSTSGTLNGTCNYGIPK